MRRKLIINLLLTLGFNILLWILLIKFYAYIIVAGILLFVSITLSIWALKRHKILKILSLAINPFVFIITFSFLAASIETIFGQPELVFVSYHINNEPYNQRDIKIKNRRSIDPEYGVLDYMISIPNNIAVRTLMSFSGEVDKKFKLIYKDELPNKLYIP